MSQETIEHLNRNILVGYAAKRGKAWHYKASAQGDEPNHYDGPIPIEDIKRRLFNFTVNEQPIFFFDKNSGTFRTIEGRKAMVTSDTLETLGVFKDGYHGHDYNVWLVDTLAKLVGEGVGFGSAGLLKNRGVAFVQLELPDNFNTKEGVAFRPNLGAATSFDGSLASIYKRSFTVWVCDNTLSAGLSEEGQQYKVKHSKYSGMKLTEARQALELIEITARQAEKEIEELCQWQVTDKQFNDFLAKLTPIPELKEGDNTRGRTLAISKAETIRNLYDTDERASPWRGTAFGVLQATNTYNHHEAAIRGGIERSVRNLENVVSGKFEKLDNDALAMLAEICEREYA
jgi:phage/plasmid-like protein (TIGR03299 family)